MTMNNVGLNLLKQFRSGGMDEGFFAGASSERGQIMNESINLKDASFSSIKEIKREIGKTFEYDASGYEIYLIQGMTGIGKSYLCNLLLEEYGYGNTGSAGSFAMDVDLQGLSQKRDSDQRMEVLRAMTVGLCSALPEKYLDTPEVRELDLSLEKESMSVAVQKLVTVLKMVNQSLQGLIVLDDFTRLDNKTRVWFEKNILAPMYGQNSLFVLTGSASLRYAEKESLKCRAYLTESPPSESYIESIQDPQFLIKTMTLGALSLADTKHQILTLGGTENDALRIFSRTGGCPKANKVLMEAIQKGADDEELHLVHRKIIESLLSELPEEESILLWNMSAMGRINTGNARFVLSRLISEKKYSLVNDAYYLKLIESLEEKGFLYWSHNDRCYVFQQGLASLIGNYILINDYERYREMHHVAQQFYQEKWKKDLSPVFVIDGLYHYVWYELLKNMGSSINYENVLDYVASVINNYHCNYISKSEMISNLLKIFNRDLRVQKILRSVDPDLLFSIKDSLSELLIKSLEESDEAST